MSALALAVIALLQTGTKSKQIVEGAKLQLTNPASYTGEYFSLKYPGGDPPTDRGACTDVVIRALRHVGYDLQQLIHEDAGKVSYPGIKKRDTNIDHRRCPNQRRFFSRFGKTLSLYKDFEPGDFVFWKLPGNLDHVGVVSDKKNSHGDYFMIHNMGRTSEEDVLHSWPIVGHYRFPIK